MLYRKVNSTFIALMAIVAAGWFMSTTQQALAAYVDECPARIQRSNPCPPGTEVDTVAAQYYCATLTFSAGGPNSCCRYRGYNKYCVAADGTRTRAGGGQDAVLINIQANSVCSSFKCLYT